MPAVARVRPRPTLAAAGLAVAVGLVLWPPGAVYWTPLAAAVGDGPTVALVAGLAVAAGAAAGRLTGVRGREFLVGTLAAYAAGVAALEATVAPDGPVYLVWYGALAGCLVGGTAVGARARRRVSSAGNG